MTENCKRVVKKEKSGGKTKCDRKEKMGKTNIITNRWEWSLEIRRKANKKKNLWLRIQGSSLRL